MSVTRISFELTNACNLHCLHCMRDDGVAKSCLPLEYIEKVLSQGRRYKAEIIVLTGGEPLLHPDIEEIVDRIAHYDYRWYIVTNGVLQGKLASLLSRPERLEKMNTVSISMDGASAEVNDRVRGEGSFRAAMKSVSYLKAKKIGFGFKTSVNTVNFHEMEDLVKMAGRLGACYVEFSHMHPTPDIVENGLMLPRSRWGEIDREIERLRGTYRIEIGKCAGARCDKPFAQCFALQMHDLHFDFRGDMSACCILPNYRGDEGDDLDIAGNIKDMDLWELHKRMVGILAGVQQAKIRKIANNSMEESDYYQCIFCLRHFGKMGWLKELDPENEWNEGIGKETEDDEQQDKAAVK